MAVKEARAPGRSPVRATYPAAAKPAGESETQHRRGESQQREGSACGKLQIRCCAGTLGSTVIHYSSCGRGSQTSALASEPRAHEGPLRA